MENQTSNTTELSVKNISKIELTSMVESGSKKEQIATHYGLNMAQTTRLLKQANLTIRKFRKPTFTLID